MSTKDRLRIFTPVRCVEWFVVGNIGFLGIDIATAHAENGFARRSEWTPIAFSTIATALLLPMAFGVGGTFWRSLERIVGAGAILIGVLGVVLHLESGFFQRQTLQYLVYSAPFVAPLAYVGVGLLLILICDETADAIEVAGWLRLLTLGGFAGNFGLSLLDHAQNGLFYWTEWIPVVAAAFATSFLFVAWVRPDPATIRATWAVLVVQALVGMIGFVLHVSSNLHRPADHWLDRFIFGAPAFAPLLFTDLAVLGALSLWATADALDNKTP